MSLVQFRLEEVRPWLAPVFLQQEKSLGVSTSNCDLMISILAPASAGEVSGSAPIQFDANDVKF